MRLYQPLKSGWYPSEHFSHIGKIEFGGSQIFVRMDFSVGKYRLSLQIEGTTYHLVDAFYELDEATSYGESWVEEEKRKRSAGGVTERLQLDALLVTN